VVPSCAGRFWSAHKDGTFGIDYPSEKV